MVEGDRPLAVVVAETSLNRATDAVLYNGVPADLATGGEAPIRVLVPDGVR
jgi:hypothetical protein